MSDLFPLGCERCHKNTNVLTMSFFNTQMICMTCDEKERQRPDFEQARKADERAIKSGNYNFKGIGL